MKNPMIISVLCALAWGTWPVLANLSKTSSTYITLIVSTVTALAVIAYFGFKGTLTAEIGQSLQSKPLGALMLPFAAGLLNVIGMILYGVLLSSNSGFDVTKYVTITTALLPAVTMIVGFLLIGQELSMQKVLGLSIIIFGIFVLNKA